MFFTKKCVLYSRIFLCFRMRFCSALRTFFPQTLLLKYHFLKSKIASWWYGMPSRKMLVIGITGTKGKSTTANFLWSIFQASGKCTGVLGTANVRIGNTEEMNKWHMTMPSPFAIQGFLRNLKNKGGEVAIVEFTSEGAKQFRHIGIEFDGALFLNLSPEHLPSHGGSYEQYKREKQKLFAGLSSSPQKIMKGQKIPKIIVANESDEASAQFLKFPADKKYFFHLLRSTQHALGIEKDPYIPHIHGKIVFEDAQKTTIEVFEENEAYSIDIFLPGEKNAENAMGAIVMARSYGISWGAIETGFESLVKIPGRMERIEKGQKFLVFVDYAHEEKSMEFIAQTGKKMLEGTSGKLLILLGAEGGGRDPEKRAKMGKIVGEMADIVMVSNVDPYEDDATKICEDIAVSAEKAGKIRGKNLFVIEDRRQGIHTIFSLAKEGDVVFITGKGSEQSMVINGKRIPWDDRNVAIEELLVSK